jgi:hypothetical protein
MQSWTGSILPTHQRSSRPQTIDRCVDAHPGRSGGSGTVPSTRPGGYHWLVLDFDAYAADCRLFGHMEPGDGRLTELLNATSELRIEDARLESLEDGHVVEIPEIVVSIGELCAVVASGPRGDVGRRLRTHSSRVTVDLGPYTVVGLVHGTPASDPLGSAVRRAAWLPLTDATVTYRRGPDSICDEVDTLLVNRTLASSFRPVEEISVALPWEAKTTLRPATSRAIDLTGTLLDDERPDRDEAEAALGSGLAL